MIDEATAAQTLFGATSPSPPATQAPSNLLVEEQPAVDPAARMFGGSDRPEFQPANAEQRQARTESESAEDMFGKGDPLPDLAPPDLKAERDANPLRQLYPAQVEYRESIPDSLLDDAPDDIPPEIRQAAIAEVREIAADMGVTNDEMSILKAVRDSIKEMPDEAQRIEWHEQAVEALNAEFGIGATQALRDAMEFARRDPRILKSLEHNGFGDHPKVVLTFARLAARAKSKSR